jgi:hypothetical protein
MEVAVGIGASQPRPGHDGQGPPPGTHPAAHGDEGPQLTPQAAKVEAELRQAIDGDVRFDPASRAMYAYAGGNVAVVVDFSRYDKGVVSLDPNTRRAVVRPDTICGSDGNGSDGA